MKLEVVFLNCKSHGDCIVITFDEDNNSACIVVDGGENKNSSKALTDFLNTNGVKKINLMIGTHIDADHINGLKHFVNEQIEKKDKGKSYIKIEEFWGPKPSESSGADYFPVYNEESGEPGYDITWQNYVIQSVNQNDDLNDALIKLNVKICHPALDNIPVNPFKKIDIKILNPDTQISADSIKKKALGIPTGINICENELDLNGLEELISDHFEEMAIEAKRNANNQSIVFKLSLKTGTENAKKWDFLFTGDAEEEAWDEMVNNNDVSEYLNSYVLKIP